MVIFDGAMSDVWSEEARHREMLSVWKVSIEIMTIDGDDCRKSSNKAMSDGIREAVLLAKQKVGNAIKTILQFPVF